jgi:azurin
MRSPLLPTVLIGALALCPMAAHAGASCTLKVEANDMMQFNTQRLTVPSACAEIELTLQHTGSPDPGGMLHNWVLVRRADMSAVATAGMKAGRAHDYRPPDDARVLAATPVIGGGQTSTIRFPTSALRQGEAYAFFCSTPGHNVIMRGELVLDPAARVADSAAGH